LERARRDEHTPCSSDEATGRDAAIAAVWRSSTIALRLEHEDAEDLLWLLRVVARAAARVADTGSQDAKRAN